MGRMFTEISAELAAWLERQRMFFVATAPLSAEGHVNCSPKGMDTFRILSPRQVAYVDLTGSGIETVAHLRENGRIVLMFCAFEGSPKIVRLHGRGGAVTPETPRFERLQALFPEHLGVRAIIHVELTRISDSCGYGVPVYQHAGQRDAIVKWSQSKGHDGLKQYQRQKNARSIDGLPGLESLAD